MILTMKSTIDARLFDPTAPAPPDTPGTVPICPHESLNRARAALIASLSSLKPADGESTDKPAKPKEVDALGPLPNAHLRLPSSDYTKTDELKTACEPLGPLGSISYQEREKAQSTIGVRGRGSYIYIPARGLPEENAKIPPQQLCLALCMTWDIYFNAASKAPRTMDFLRKDLEKANVKLCPHKYLHDREFLEAIIEVLNPDLPMRDPIVRFRTTEEGYNCKFRLRPSSFFMQEPCILIMIGIICNAHTSMSIHKPTSCSLGIRDWKFTVTTSRFLGQEENDEEWTRSCIP